VTMLRQAARKLVHGFRHVMGRITGRYYFEDFGRVYPDDVAFTRLGTRRDIRPIEVRNYLNHRKFYRFAAQFAAGKAVADVGCGSGYGAEIVSQHQARSVHACDVSTKAVAFAQSRFGALAEFCVQGITDLHGYADGAFDLTISSEVLEHIKEYGLERQALRELKRVTKPGGLLVLGTPNIEMLGDHGFAFDEIAALLGPELETFVIFENALIPWEPDALRAWEARAAGGRTGTIVTEAINLEETVLPPGVVPRIKRGIAAGTYDLGAVRVDTTLLHNTHSWVVVARRDAAPSAAPAPRG